MKATHIASMIMLCLGVNVAWANDTTVVLGAGGLEFRKSDTVRMLSEKLKLSPVEVSVDYEMQNSGPAEVETLVAFPLPVQNAAELVNVPSIVKNEKSVNFVNFTVKVDGRDISPEVELRAFLIEGDRREITEDLKKVGLLIPPVSPDFYKALVQLSEEAKRDLEAKSLITIDRFEGQDDTYTPTWELRTNYYWKQKFPVGKVLKIHHAYAPVVSHNYWGEFSFGDEKKEWCVDAETESALRKMLSKIPKSQNEGQVLERRLLEYVLKTGANWAGPIESFTLQIEKDRPDQIVSLCMDGLQKKDPLHFEITRKNFTPDSDLKVMFVNPYRGSTRSGNQRS